MLPYSPTQVVLLQDKEADGLTIYPFLIETLWESSEEEYHLSHPLLLLVCIISSNSNRDASGQTKEVLSFSLALRQLQEATQAKAEIEWGLTLKLEVVTKNYEDQQFRMVQKKEDQWTRVVEQMDTTFREVLSKMSQANLVGLLPWFLSTAAKSGVGPACSVSEALTAILHPRVDAPMDDTTLELEDTTVQASMSSPTHPVSTPPPALPTSDIPATGTPVGHLFFALTLSLKYKKWDCSSNNTPESQSSKRACTGTEEGSISSECCLLSW